MHFSIKTVVNFFRNKTFRCHEPLRCFHCGKIGAETRWQYGREAICCFIHFKVPTVVK